MKLRMMRITTCWSSSKKKCFSATAALTCSMATVSVLSAMPELRAVWAA
eukprot:CAMPEP_0204210104 /NCGR_PEP_ID=MMETSP0361-20130328/73699_1 /ASSEMBLY_ACC=CAM_ASM_000343 /TAXON_ID=268821 /ORGANISM="Scrippsiella Hangoei, Strain SHTV-5" /LENGTH=48 /DNA_ID= /DNA_START= /DNA_END= /DNA_ORIENTATION=